jgi:hypothetical protein
MKRLRFSLPMRVLLGGLIAVPVLSLNLLFYPFYHGTFALLCVMLALLGLLWVEDRK